MPFSNPNQIFALKQEIQDYKNRSAEQKRDMYNANTGLLEHFSKPATYRDWAHDINAFIRRSVQKVPGAIPNIAGGTYDLATKGADQFISLGDLGVRTAIGKGDSWRYKSYLNPEAQNNWGYKIGAWLNKHIGQPIQKTVNIPGQLIDKATSQTNHSWYGPTQYSKALQQSGGQPFMNFLEASAAQASVGYNLGRLARKTDMALQKMPTLKQRAVLRQLGLNPNDYKATGTVNNDLYQMFDTANPKQLLFVRGHKTLPQSPNLIGHSSYTGSNPHPQRLWFATNMNAPYIGNFKKASDPIIVANDKYMQKWRNGYPVITYDMPTDIVYHKVRSKTPVSQSLFSDGRLRDRKRLAISQQLIPHNKKLAPYYQDTLEAVRQLPKQVVGTKKATEDIMNVLLPIYNNSDTAKLFVRKGNPVLIDSAIKLPGYRKWTTYPQYLYANPQKNK